MKRCRSNPRAGSFPSTIPIEPQKLRTRAKIARRSRSARKRSYTAIPSPESESGDKTTSARVEAVRHGPTIMKLLAVVVNSPGRAAGTSPLWSRPSRIDRSQRRGGGALGSAASVWGSL